MSASAEDVLLLHGFGGTHRTWDDVVGLLPPERYRPLALDLPGHGAAADAPQPLTFAGCVEHVLERAPARFVLCGYSLGGRVALHVALAAPERVTRLVLVSSTPGIEDDAARAARRDSDRRLADGLERAPLADFIARWCSQPMFAEDSPAVDALARADYSRNRPDALAAVLRGIGTGEMAPLWGALAQLTMPVIVLVGERDVKFRELGQQMVAVLPHAELAIVPGGHRLPLESAAVVAGALQRTPTTD